MSSKSNIIVFHLDTILDYTRNVNDINKQISKSLKAEDIYSSAFYNLDYPVRHEVCNVLNKVVQPELLPSVEKLITLLLECQEVLPSVTELVFRYDMPTFLATAIYRRLCPKDWKASIRFMTNALCTEYTKTLATQNSAPQIWYIADSDDAENLLGKLNREKDRLVKAAAEKASASEPEPAKEEESETDESENLDEKPKSRRGRKSSTKTSLDEKPKEESSEETPKT